MPLPPRRRFKVGIGRKSSFFSTYKMQFKSFFTEKCEPQNVELQPLGHGFLVSASIHQACFNETPDCVPQLFDYQQRPIILRKVFNSKLNVEITGCVSIYTSIYIGCLFLILKDIGINYRLIYGRPLRKR